MVLHSWTWTLMVIACILCDPPKVLCSKSTNTTIFSGFRAPITDFGPYKVTIKLLDTCNTTFSRKSVNYCGLDLYLNKINRYTEAIEGLVYLPKNILFTEGRINADLLKNGVYVPTYYAQFKRPCHHPIFSQVLDFLTPDANCNVKGGNYTIKGLNCNKLMHKIMDNFVYGHARVQLEWLSAGEVACCIIQTIELAPLRARSKGKRRG